LRRLVYAAGMWRMSDLEALAFVAIVEKMAALALWAG
jgi:hypothetical protein